MSSVDSARERRSITGVVAAGYLWQVAGSDEWLVCWKTCEDKETALEAEAALLKAFGEAHNGRLPFANLRL